MGKRSFSYGGRLFKTVFSRKDAKTQRRKDLISSMLRMLEIRLTQNSERSLRRSFKFKITRQLPPFPHDYFHPPIQPSAFLRIILPPGLRRAKAFPANLAGACALFNKIIRYRFGPGLR